jgi:hypothetical protein
MNSSFVFFRYLQINQTVITFSHLSRGYEEAFILFGAYIVLRQSPARWPAAQAYIPNQLVPSRVQRSACNRKSTTPIHRCFLYRADPVASSREVCGRCHGHLRYRRPESQQNANLDVRSASSRESRPLIHSSTNILPRRYGSLLLSWILLEISARANKEDITVLWQASADGSVCNRACRVGLIVLEIFPQIKIMIFPSN